MSSRPGSSDRDAHVAASKRYHVGERVRLIGAHPWSGSSGVIVSSFTAAGLDWEVRLDNGDYPNHQVAASESDLEAKYALMNAALRASIACEERDQTGTALWRARADEAREYLRAAYGVPAQLELPVAA